MKRIFLAIALAVAAATLVAQPASAQAPLAYSPTELDRLVRPIALYPDPLLAQVLAAATYSSEIPDAAHWADDHRAVDTSRLTAAMAADDVRWDPSVQALLPFPSVLETMARDMGWTDELGKAVLTDRAAVMDAVQRMRHDAWTYGYLRSNAAITVTSGPYIEIVPFEGYMPVPYYDPLIVFAAPRPGIFVGSAIDFGHGVRLGAAFAPWGWGSTRLMWPSHVMVINRVPWGRTWADRMTYVHPYEVRRYAGHPGAGRHLPSHYATPHARERHR